MICENKMGKDTYIHFDWAMKRMLRDKANFGVPEGIEKGRAEEKRKLAKGFKETGTPAATIAQVTGLGMEEIEAL